MFSNAKSKPPIPLNNDPNLIYLHTIVYSIFVEINHPNPIITDNKKIQKVN